MNVVQAEMADVVGGEPVSTIILNTGDQRETQQELIDIPPTVATAVECVTKAIQDAESQVDLESFLIAEVLVEDKVKAFLKRFARLVGMVWVSPILVLYLGTTAKATIILDVRRWLVVFRRENDSDLIGLLFLFSAKLEFRNLFYYRLRKGNLVPALCGKLFEVLYHPSPTLFINAKRIGPGLFIQHGTCTHIGVESMGSNCWINQQVTIGHMRSQGRPTLGNNVTVTAGAKVLGKICIGDNVTVGANAVVVKDVPKNCTVVGVPAYIIRRDGIRVNEEL
jgi:serine O-acetyltransferase